MFKITKFDEFDIKGSGKVFSVHLDDHPEMKECNIGDIIIANNKKWEVINIQIYWKLISPPVLGKNRGFVLKEKP